MPLGAVRCGAVQCGAVQALEWWWGRGFSRVAVSGAHSKQENLTRWSDGPILQLRMRLGGVKFLAQYPLPHFPTQQGGWRAGRDKQTGGGGLAHERRGAADAHVARVENWIVIIHSVLQQKKWQYRNSGMTPWPLGTTQYLPLQVEVWMVCRNRNPRGQMRNYW